MKLERLVVSTMMIQKEPRPTIKIIQVVLVVVLHFRLAILVGGSGHVGSFCESAVVVTQPIPKTRIPISRSVAQSTMSASCLQTVSVVISECVEGQSPGRDRCPVERLPVLAGIATGRNPERYNPVATRSAFWHARFS